MCPFPIIHCRLEWNVITMRARSRASGMRASIRPWPNRNRSYGEAHRPARDPPIRSAIPRETFIIAVDAGIVTDENFPNILLDIALLRSLNIRVVVVHGAAEQI
jgi:hypothetical protein